MGYFFYNEGLRTAARTPLRTQNDRTVMISATLDQGNKLNAEFGSNSFLILPRAPAEEVLLSMWEDLGVFLEINEGVSEVVRKTYF